MSDFLPATATRQPGQPSESFLDAITGGGLVPPSIAGVSGRTPYGASQPAGGAAESASGGNPLAGLEPGLRQQVEDFIRQQVGGEGPISREQHNAQQAKARKRADSLEKRVKELEAEKARLEAAAVPEVGEVVRSALQDAMVEGDDGTSFLDPAKAAEAFSKAMETVLASKLSGTDINVERKIEEAFAYRGLSADQRDAVAEIRERYPNDLTPDKVLQLARLEHPELFRDTAPNAGTSFAGQPGRGSAAEAETPTSPTSRQVADFLMSLPPDDPRAQDAGPYLIKADMEENFPGIHGRTRR